MSERCDNTIHCCCEVCLPEYILTELGFEFITINKDKSKGPFLVRRSRHDVGLFGKREKALSAVRKSIAQHARWILPAFARPRGAAA